MPVDTAHWLIFPTEGESSGLVVVTCNRGLRLPLTTTLTLSPLSVDLKRVTAHLLCEQLSSILASMPQCMALQQTLRICKAVTCGLLALLKTRIETQLAHPLGAWVPQMAPVGCTSRNGVARSCFNAIFGAAAALAAARSPLPQTVVLAVLCNFLRNVRVMLFGHGATHARSPPFAQL